MKIVGSRKLGQHVLEAILIRALWQLEVAESSEAVIKALGLTHRFIYKWKVRYREEGVEAFNAKSLSGRPSKLTGLKLPWIFKTVTKNNPLPLQSPHVFWTHEMIDGLVTKN